MIDIATMTLDAQRAGFTVFEEDGLWYIRVPKRPRMPANVQGSWKTAERAWRAAATIAQDYPDPG